MANYSGWTLLWTFLGFALIFAGTARDSWTQTADRIGSIEFAGDRTPTSMMLQKSFGALDYKESFQDGYGYGNPDVCQSKKRRDDMQELSAGMIAMLLLSNGAGFLASFLTILAATDSTITRTYKGARTAAVFAFIFTLVTWIVWLAVGDEILANKIHDEEGDPNPNNNSTCRFDIDVPFSGPNGITDPDWRSIRNVSNEPAGSLGLTIAGWILYFILVAMLSKRVKAEATSDRVNGGLALIFVALAAFAAIFAATVYNVWTHGTGPGEDAVEDNLDNFIASNNSTGTSEVFTETRYGVYTATYFQQHIFNYNDIQNRAYFCSDPLEFDDAGRALVHGGRVVLGFAIAACLLAFVATLAQIQANPKAFWISVLAVLCAVVSLVCWSLVNDYIIKDRCCDAPYCELGDSFGLVAVGAFFLIVAIFYQAWVISDDIYVLHPPHAYGMAAKQEEMTVNP